MDAMSAADSTYLLGIGDFSRFARLSVRMLRHYDERGLLVPAHVDPFNGYRFYSPAQLKVATRIRTLRDVGCGISQIAQMLPLFQDPAALRQVLADHARTLEAAAKQLADQRSLLSVITQQIEESAMSIAVSERTVAAKRVLSLRRTIPGYHAEGELWEEFNRLLHVPGGPEVSQYVSTGATFYDTDYRDADIDLSVWVEVRGDFSPLEGLTATTMPAQRVAWATMVGPYDQTAGVCEAIGAWIAEHGYTVAGPMFNLYLVDPSMDPNPENWITELNFPIAG